MFEAAAAKITALRFGAGEGGLLPVAVGEAAIVKQAVFQSAAVKVGSGEIAMMEFTPREDDFCQLQSGGKKAAYLFAGEGAFPQLLLLAPRLVYRVPKGIVCAKFAPSFLNDKRANGEPARPLAVFSRALLRREWRRPP